jgi:hypothetical protein
MQTKRLALVIGTLISAALLLAACGGGGGGTTPPPPGGFPFPGGGGGTNPPPPPPPGGGGGAGSISGTITGSQNLQGMTVIACFFANNTCDSQKSASGTYNGTASNFPYTFDNMAAGNYAIVGWLDANGNNTIDAGDIGGCALSGNSCATNITPPRTGVNFQVGVLSAASTNSLGKLNLDSIGLQAK